MAASKKSAKSKLIPEDVMDSRQFMKGSAKPKKTLKRETEIESEEDDMSTTVRQYLESAKKKKAEIRSETNPETRKKILDLVDNQLVARKQCNENLFKGLLEITTQVEEEYNAMKENEQKLEHLTGSYMKCIQQATIAYKHKLKALKDIQLAFKKECDVLESDHKTETEKVVNELEYDIKKLQDQLVAETKRSGWENLRRSIFNAMQNDL